jgi:hypothetical protein
MTSTFITAYVGKGLAAARPAAPAIAAGTFGWYYATDTAVLSFYDGTWHTVSSSDPSISFWTTVPASPGWDSQFIGTTIPLTNSNKTATPASSIPYNYAYANVAKTGGKAYFEMAPGSTSFTALGLAGPRGHLVDNGIGSPGLFGTAIPGQIGWAADGTVKTCGIKEGSVGTLTTIATWTSANRLSFAIDLDNALLWLRVDAGNWNNNAANNPATGVGGISVPHLFGGGPRMAWPGGNLGAAVAYNLYLKTADFTQAVPAGFGSWSGL